jgi:hypothetical protein
MGAAQFASETNDDRGKFVDSRVREQLVRQRMILPDDHGEA